MRLRIEVLDGAREGVRRTFDAARVTLGRHPDSDLQLDPEEDRAVSTRHAALLQAGGRWLVRDMGSRNGTYVGREEVTGDRRLRDGDVLRLGREGPRLRVEMVAADAGSAADAGGGDRDREEADRSGGGRGLVALGAVLTAAAGLGAAYLLLNGLPGGGSGPDPAPIDPADSAAAESRPAGSAGADSGASGATPAGPGATEAGAGRPPTAAAPAGTASSGTSAGDDSAETPAARPATPGTAAAESGAAAGDPGADRTDSVLRATRRTLDSLRGRVSGLQEALQASRREVAGIRERLRRAERQEGEDPEAGGESARRLRRRLDSARADLERQSALAGADFDDVEERHWRAVARIFVQDGEGEVAAATAFAVRAGGLLITSRHVVLEPDGDPVPRIGVQFARSDQVWPGELVATTDAADLALVRARNVQGDVPIVAALGDEDGAVEIGSPVAVLGYSEGPMSSMGESGRLARPGLSVGLLAERGERLLRVRGFGARGGSGSPIFDEDGRLVGVLRGGVEDDGGPEEERLLVAVPASRVRSFIAAVMDRLER